MIHHLRARLQQQRLWQRASTMSVVHQVKVRLWPTPLLLPEHLYRHLTRRSTTFRFAGKDYPYHFHHHEVSGLTERTVEIPIAEKLVEGVPPNSVLEVGNVLSHYIHVRHDVVDKYEVAPGVLNTDVVDFHPGRKYDLIISISTLEHVGWNESPPEGRKWMRAIRHLRTLLGPKGFLVATLPVGWNPQVDAALRSGALEFDELYAMRRVSRRNDWVEASIAEVGDAEYGRPFPFANAIIIGFARATGGCQAHRPPPYGM